MLHACELDSWFALSHVNAVTPTSQCSSCVRWNPVHAYGGLTCAILASAGSICENDACSARPQSGHPIPASRVGRVSQKGSAGEPDEGEEHLTPRVCPCSCPLFPRSFHPPILLSQVDVPHRASARCICFILSFRTPFMSSKLPRVVIRSSMLERCYTRCFPDTEIQMTPLPRQAPNVWRFLDCYKSFPLSVPLLHLLNLLSHSTPLFLLSGSLK